MHAPLTLRETLGLSPFGERARQAWIALRGAEDVPPSRFGVSSLRLLRPRMAWPLWRGRPHVAGKVILTNLFNHRQTPVGAGWSVKRTQVEDFRGRDMTYDSHNGTDLSVPVGAELLAAAPGRVVRVLAEFNRGGLKVYIDHGRGLMTCSAHLARALVAEGDLVRRGQPVALTGYSGLDGFSTFPFGVPHVHFNTWLNGEPVDPFPRADEPSLWRGGANPRPIAESDDDPYEPSAWDAGRLQSVLAACRTASVRERLLAVEPLERRAAYAITEMNYYPTRFPVRELVYAERHPREPRLDLPFRAVDFDGVVFADEL